MSRMRTHIVGSKPRVGRLGLRALDGHAFWPDDISLVGSPHLDASRIMTHAQVTDFYLLALAKTHGGQLATFDRKLSPAAVKGGSSALHLIAAG
jgi:predicted nucleic acid-binding protein